MTNCGVVYRVERDSPIIQRLEVSPKGGLLAGVTYYSMNNEINTIGFTLASTTSHRQLREAARNAYGAPSAQWKDSGFNYEEWSNVGGVKLTIFENGGSIFYP